MKILITNNQKNKLFENIFSDGDVHPDKRAIKHICDSEKFCTNQGPITFGQFKALVDDAKSKYLLQSIGEGGYKASLRLFPWFFPQASIAGFFGSGLRAFNKILRPALEYKKTYKSWWGKVITKVLDLAEGELDIKDPISKIFFVSDGLLSMLNEKSKLDFTMYISEIASMKDDSEPVPDFFVENELRGWLNKRFLLDPPLPPKINNYDDSEEIKEVFMTEWKKPMTLISDINISKELNYHIENKLPLGECIFRYGSTKFFELINEVKELYETNNILLNENDEFIINDLSPIKLNEKIIIDFIQEDNTPSKEQLIEGKKTPELNKPKRGGSKKFYVYVKDPKTKKIKKVSFGAKSGGGKLAVKLKDPKARKAFADRHNCEQKNDKTTPGYWSCRLPRYAKLLGLSGSGKWW